MSGRTSKRQDRAKACWHDPADRDTERSLVTAQRREEMRQLALDDPAKFIRCLSLASVISLKQLPWWPEFKLSYPWEASELTLMAADKNISDK